MRIEKVSSLSESHKEWLLGSALYAQRHGVNHRGFKVGVSMLLEHGHGQQSMLSGSNFKPCPGSKGPRICAEMRVIDSYQLLNPRRTRVKALGISAPYQVDDELGIDMEGTLPPCKHCRPLLRQLVEKGALSSATPIVSMVVEEPSFELQWQVVHRNVRPVEYTLGEFLEKFNCVPSS